MVSVETDDADGVLVATIDDGKANALTATVIDGVRSAVADASRRGRPLVITGRDGCFSGGFDLAVMRSGQPDLVAALFAEGAHLYRDVVRGASPDRGRVDGPRAGRGGRCCCSPPTTRIGRAGPDRIGLNEVAIGMPLPPIAVAMATHRLEPRFLTAATMFAETGSPERALAMGFFDELAEDPRSVACSSAASLAQLPQEAFATTKRRIRRGLVQEPSAPDRR